MILLRQASYRYPSGDFCVGPVDLQVKAGERLLITGASGSGKSTLLRLMAGLLQRHGRGHVQGSILLSGQDPGAVPAHSRVSLLGFVPQDTEDASISGTVEEEVAFSLENRGDEAEQILQRVAQLLPRLGLINKNKEDPRSLSGGQLQRLLVAAALAGGAPVLLLDEPLAQLDPVGAEELLEVLRRQSEEGVAVIMVEHRLELALRWASRTVVLQHGQVVADPLFSPQDLPRWGLQPPQLELLSMLRPGIWRARAPCRWRAPPPGPMALQTCELGYGWPGRPPLFQKLNLQVHRGERVALMGGNGVGKSSLLGVLAGRLRPRSGKLSGQRAIPVPQNPDLSLFCATVADEIAFAMQERGEDPAVVQQQTQRLAESMGLEDLLNLPPQSLSRGQRLRVAVAAALAAGPALLLLDEPSAGQDLPQVERMFLGLPRDLALLFACHDPEVVLREATRLWVLMPDVLLDGPPLEILQEALRRGAPLRLPPLAELGLSLGIDATGMTPLSFAKHLEDSS